MVPLVPQCTPSPRSIIGFDPSLKNLAWGFAQKPMPQYGQRNPNNLEVATCLRIFMYVHIYGWSLYFLPSSRYSRLWNPWIPYRTSHHLVHVTAILPTLRHISSQIFKFPLHFLGCTGQDHTGQGGHAVKVLMSRWFVVTAMWYLQFSDVGSG